MFSYVVVVVVGLGCFGVVLFWVGKFWEFGFRFWVVEGVVWGLVFG